MENNFNRHFQELKKKYESLRQNLLNKPYFNEIPSLNEDPELMKSVFLLNTPFIEEAKRAKFTTYMEKRVVSKFKDIIQDYIFPYKNSDKEELGNNAILIIKMISADEAINAAKALNGIQIDKNHKAIAIIYSEYENIANLPDSEEIKKGYDVYCKWEKSNFTEMLCIESKNKITVGTCHFLKKTFNVNYKLNNNDNINEIKWSPQGKYLVLNYPNKISMYGNENDTPLM